MKKLLLILTAGMIWISSFANNVVISNVSLVNGGTNNIYVQFSLSWENSWRIVAGPANYDGVWVFFKYKTPGGDWQHLYLNTNTTADLLPAGFEYFRPVSGVSAGAVIHRSVSNTGTGSITATGMRLSVANNVGYDIELRSFAIEMVYIPAPAAGEIRFGDGSGTLEGVSAFHPAGSDNNHTRNNLNTNVDVNSVDDAEIETPNDFVINFPDGLNGLPINNNLFPTGSAIWCMKYEVTQGAYRDFLNTLTLTQQTNRTNNIPTAPTGSGALTISGTNRNYIEINIPSDGTTPAVYGCDASGNDIYDENNDGEFIACNFLGWVGLAAWLDWSGMAPMTEIHFERICRGATSAGPILPVFNEFAWGNSNIVAGIFLLSNPNQASELVSNSALPPTGNANYSFTYPDPPYSGPLRNGIFATSTSNRISSGAAFYGVMDMSGNVLEQCIGVGTVAGRSYNKLGTSRGNGVLSINGNADVPHWPGNQNSSSVESTPTGEIIFASGTKLRGGSWISGQSLLQVSDRSQGVSSIFGNSQHGGRGVIVPAMY